MKNKCKDCCEVTAYKDSKGVVHTTKKACEEAELDYRLKLSPTNEISIKPVEDAKELLKQRDDIENQINSIRIRIRI